MIVFKEEFVGGEKWRRAVKLGGSDAIVLWLAMKAYALRHPRNAGLIPDEDIDILRGAPRDGRKSLQSLVDCGRLMPSGARGPGLVESAEGGWLLLDDAAIGDPAIDARREAWRRRKRASRAARRALTISPDAVGAYCGDPSPLMTIDHVVPRCQGGTDDAENLVPACPDCNTRKGGRTPEQAGMVRR